MHLQTIVTGERATLWALGPFIPLLFWSGLVEAKDTYEIMCTLLQAPDKWKTPVWYNWPFNNRAHY